MVVPSLQSICGSILDRYIVDGKLHELGDENPYCEYIQESESDVNTEMMGLYDEEIVFNILKNRVLYCIKNLSDVLYNTRSNCLVYGDIQSGKTKLMIACSWWFQYVEKKSSFLVLRNITQDYYQFSKRVKEFNKKYIQNEEFYVNECYIKSIREMPDKPTVIVCLLNRFQMRKVVRFVYEFRNVGECVVMDNSRYVRFVDHRFVEDEGCIYINKNCYKYEKIDNNNIKVDRKFRRGGMYEGEEIFVASSVNYMLQVDEVDVSVKSTKRFNQLDHYFGKVHSGGLFVVGYSATPMFTLLNGGFDRLVKMDRPDDYVGINDLNIQENTDLDDIYNKFMRKKHGMMLHNTSMYRKKHHEIARKLYGKYRSHGLVVIVQNSSGLCVYGSGMRYNVRRIGGLKIDGRNYKKTGTMHRFSNMGISVVLQILKENGVTHVSIIARMIASRGMSYVSYDYGWHITDQILDSYRNTSDNLLQSIRCCGIWKVDKGVTLWTTKYLKARIKQYYMFVVSYISGICGNSKGGSIDRSVLDGISFYIPVKSIFNMNRMGYRWRRVGDNMHVLETV